MASHSEFAVSATEPEFEGTLVGLSSWNAVRVQQRASGRIVSCILHEVPMDGRSINLTPDEREALKSGRQLNKRAGHRYQLLRAVFNHNDAEVQVSEANHSTSTHFYFVIFTQENEEHLNSMSRAKPGDTWWYEPLPFKQSKVARRCKAVLASATSNLVTLLLPSQTTVGKIHVLLARLALDQQDSNLGNYTGFVCDFEELENSSATNRIVRVFVRDVSNTPAAIAARSASSTISHHRSFHVDPVEYQQPQPLHAHDAGDVDGGDDDDGAYDDDALGSDQYNADAYDDDDGAYDDAGADDIPDYHAMDYGRVAAAGRAAAAAASAAAPPWPRRGHPHATHGDGMRTTPPLGAAGAAAFKSNSPSPPTGSSAAAAPSSTTTTTTTTSAALTQPFGAPTIDYASDRTMSGPPVSLPPPGFVMPFDSNSSFLPPHLILQQYQQQLHQYQTQQQHQQQRQQQQQQPAGAATSSLSGPSPFATMPATSSASASSSNLANSFTSQPMPFSAFGAGPFDASAASMQFGAPTAPFATPFGPPSSVFGSSSSAFGKPDDAAQQQPFATYNAWMSAGLAPVAPTDIAASFSADPLVAPTPSAPTGAAVATGPQQQPPQQQMTPQQTSGSPTSAAAAAAAAAAASAEESVPEILTRINCAAYINSFAANAISDLEMFCDLNDNELRELGVQALGHRKLILREIARIKGTAK